MHTGTKCTKQALKQIIRNIKAKGYEFVSVSRLIYRSNYRIDPTGKQIKFRNKKSSKRTENFYKTLENLDN